MIQQVKEPDYELKLYIAGRSSRSKLAVANFETLCHECLKDRYSAIIIDIQQEPQMAKLAQIIATPTLVKESPGEIKKMVGTLSDTINVLAALDL